MTPMITPMMEIVAYLIVTFFLGLSLGASIWKLGSAQKVGTVRNEKDFWQKRVQEARAERDQDQDKIERLEAECQKLKDKLKAALSQETRKAS